MRAWGRTLPKSEDGPPLVEGAVERVGGRSWQPSSNPSKKACQVGSTLEGSVFQASCSSSRKAVLPGWPKRPRAGEGEEDVRFGLSRSSVARAGSLPDKGDVGEAIGTIFP